MKKLIASLVMVFAMVATVGATTYAVFTATDTITGNTISTAELSIVAFGEERGGVTAKPIADTSALVPGESTDWYRGAIRNESGVDVRLYMHVANVSSTACRNNINLEVTTGHASNGGAGEQAYELHNGPLNGLNGPGKRVEITGNALTVLGDNITAVVQQQATLDENAPNSMQGETCTWDEVFTAESIASGV